MINRLWKKLKNSKEKNRNIENRWKSIGSLSHLQEILHHSVQQPALIFKHSTRCPVSSRAYFELERATDALIKHQVDIYYVDVIADRQLSNDIARVLDVIHQSPQAIFIKNKEVVWDDSHSGVSQETLEQLS